MQFVSIFVKALASALLFSSVAVALPAAQEGSVTLPEGAVKIISVLSANGTKTCHQLECSCMNKAAKAILCVVPLGGDKTKCGNVCTGINRQT